MATTKPFDEIYREVPAEQRDALRDFRAAYPQQSLHVDGVAWTYHRVGKGERTLLWLVGGLKKADAAYRSIPLLADDFRILAPDYPPVESMEALCDGLAAILDAEAVKTADVLSGSFGGMIAQEFLRRYPERAAKVVLSTTTPPDSTQSERYEQLLQMVEAAPEELVRQQAESQFFSIIAPPESEAAFYRAYLHELFQQRLGKADIASTYRAILDFMVQVYSPDDLADWQGELLILDSDDDATFQEEARQRMYSLYPLAQTHTFQGAGHSPGSTQREAFFQRVRDFFQS